MMSADMRVGSEATRPLGERFAEVVRWTAADAATTVAWTSGTTTGGFGSLPPDTDAGIDVPD